MKFNFSKILSNLNVFFVVLVLALICISLKLIYELNTALFAKEVKYLLLSCILVGFYYLIPFKKLYYTWIGAYLFVLLLLICVHFFGAQKNFATRWINIPFTSFSIQPSELIKITIMLLMATYVYRNPPPYEGYDWKQFGILSAIILVPFFSILLEPDLGTALIVLISGYGVVFLVGVDRKIWLTILGSLALIIPIGSKIVFSVGLLKEYHQKRIEDFIHGNYQYQVKQAIIAIGNGGIIGNHVEEAFQGQLKFMPYADTDFIFAYFIERFGLFGGIGLLGIYLGIIFYALKVAISTSDYFLKVVSAFVGFLFLLYASVNMLMVMGLSPVVGVPLPLVSYGGTSAITFITIIAIFVKTLALKNTFHYN